MNRVVSFLQKYFAVISLLIGISILLSITFSSYIVTSNNHKAAEMYIGELKYSIEIDGTTTNTLTVPAGETIIDVKVNNLNPVDTYYKLLYLENTNITVKYYESTKDTDDVVTTYSNPNDSITSSNSNTIKLLITNNSTSSQNIALTMKGGYITNTIQDITTPSTYSEITLVETPSTNTYFCKTNDTLTQGLQYVNGQYTYAYKQEGKYGSTYGNLIWKDISENGWGVQLTNKESTDDVTSKVCTYVNNKAIISMAYMLSESKATTMDLSHFNTSKVTTMDSMFQDTKATTLDLSSFDTSNVTSMFRMFYASEATTLDLSSFDTSKVTNMQGMFNHCQTSIALNLSNFDTSNVITMINMFSNSKFTILNLSSFDTSKVTDMSGMFYESTNLKTIYTSDKFNTDNVTYDSSMFINCTNLVGGAGTTYNSSYVDKTYAHIDGGTSNPGYFTDIADKPSEPNSFATDSWPTIINAVKNNNIGKYNVGDTKEIDMGTYGTHTLRIANTSTPSECSTSGFSQTACGFVIEFADIITTKAINSTGTNIGGWPASSIYTFVNNDIYNLLPVELKNGIMDTTTISGHGNGDSSNFTSIDKLYLLGTSEVWANGHSNDTSKDVTRQLDYYKNLGVTISNYGEAIKKNGSSASSWWLRTANSTYPGYFLYVTNNGGCGGNYASSTFGVSPAFRIG